MDKAVKKAILSVAKIYLTTILLALLQKLIFLTIYFDRAAEIGMGGLFGVLWHGLILDISTAGYVTALPLLLLIIGAWCGWLISPRVWRGVLGGYLALIAVLIALIASIDVNLYGYWGYRVDATLIPYLLTPTEAAASVTAIDVFRSLTSLIVLLCASFFGYRCALRGFAIESVPVRQRVYNTFGLLLLGGVLFLGIRGGVEESTANVSKVYFSSNQFANHAAVNPSFSLLSSVSEAKRYDQMYRYFDVETMREEFAKVRPSRVRSEPGTRDGEKRYRPNILFIIGESYTRSLMDAKVDGREVMPNLLKLAREGLFFENLYAVGARTDKGVASVFSGFPSQPKVSIMKIPAKSRNLPSVARSLVREGYSTHFYYGGDLDFMDMSSYLYGTGWQYLTAQSDIPLGSKQVNKWGYSDGVMVELVADSLAQLSRRAEPYLAALLTLSSHEPFDVPEQLGFRDLRVNSMAYTDKQIGRLVEMLRESGAWDDLLMVIVGDHTLNYDDEIAYNSPKRHHIPLIWSGGALRHFGTKRGFASQMDIAPTLLSELGVESGDFIFGRDMFGDDCSAAQFGYYTFSDGAAVVDSLGAVVYDNTSGRWHVSPVRGQSLEASERVDERARVLLQMTHQTIEEL